MLPKKSLVMQGGLGCAGDKEKKKLLVQFAQPTKLTETKFNFWAKDIMISICNIKAKL